MALFDQEDTFDENKDYLAELIGPGGKFDVAKYGGDKEAAIKAMAKGKAFADRTLDFTLKEKDELRDEFLKVRAENTAQAKFEELLTKLENRDGNRDTANNLNAGDVEQPQIDPKQIEDLVTTKIQEIGQRQREKDNMDKVEKRLMERFGDNAKNILKDKMNTLGITDDDIKYLAKKSPEAVFNALGLNQQQQDSYQAPPRSNTRSDNFSPTSGETRDAVYWEKMRQTNPLDYFSPKTSVQRLQDMEENPDFLKRINERRT